MRISISISSLIRRLRALAARGPDGELLTPDDRHNSLIVRLEVPLTNFAFGLGGFFALFAIRLGADNHMVGWLTSGPALLNLLWLIPCGRLIQRSSSYKKPLLIGMFTQRLILASIAFVPFLPATWRVTALVVLASVATIPQFTWILAFQSSAGEMFSPRQMTAFMGQRWSLGSISNVLFNYVVGRLLDVIAFPLNFQATFFASGILSQLSILPISRLRLPPRPAPATPLGNTQPRGLWATMRAHPTFLRFEIGVFMGYLAICAALPLFSIYWVRDLGATGAWVGSLNAVYLFGSTVGTFLWGRWCNLGNDRRNLTIAAAGAMVGYPLMTALFGSLWPLLLLGAVAGFFVGGYELQMFNRMVQLSPRAERPNFIAAHNFVQSIAGVIAPMCSAALATQLGTRPVLALTGALGLAGAALIYFLGWEDAGRPRTVASQT